VNPSVLQPEQLGIFTQQLLEPRASPSAAASKTSSDSASAGQLLRAVALALVKRLENGPSSLAIARESDACRPGAQAGHGVVLRPGDQEDRAVLLSGE
jgi:hypothetical protein